MWLKEFKVAVLERNTDRIGKLLDTMPSFEDVQSMEEAAYLLLEASKIMKNEQDATQESLRKLDQNIKFLKSTQTDKTSQFNLTL